MTWPPLVPGEPSGDPPRGCTGILQELWHRRRRRAALHFRRKPYRCEALASSFINSLIKTSLLIHAKLKEEL